MANLPSDNVTLGNFVRELSKNRAKCKEMEKDIDFATREFGTLMSVPSGHKIKVHLDEENITHVIIPRQEDIKEAEEEVTSTGRGYPELYVRDPLNPLLAFKASENPQKALSFRIGEYTMRRCKG